MICIILSLVVLCSPRPSFFSGSDINHRPVSNPSLIFSRRATPLHIFLCFLLSFHSSVCLLHFIFPHQYSCRPLKFKPLSSDILLHLPSSSRMLCFNFTWPTTSNYSTSLSTHYLSELEDFSFYVSKTDSDFEFDITQASKTDTFFTKSYLIKSLDRRTLASSKLVFDDKKFRTSEFPTRGINENG
jgi:hypothetical protein